jgi:hypothetical protein
MKSALLAIVGVSLLAATAACDSGSDGEGGSGGTGAGPVMSGGTSAGTGTAAGSGTGGSAGSGTGGTGTPTAGVPLTPTDGWIAADSNTLMVQGAVFSFADDFSKKGPPEMTSNFMGSNACIAGVAAKVDKMCTPPAGMDCYGVYWGAAIGLNLNQPNVPDPMDPTKMIGGMAMAYDATAIKGFAFEIAGPAGAAGMIPTSLRFKVDDGSTTVEYCTGEETPIKAGENTVMFDQLRTKCWEKKASQMAPMFATAIQSKVVKIAWQVVTKDAAAIPFDFCVNNIRAIQ